MAFVTVCGAGAMGFVNVGGPGMRSIRAYKLRPTQPACVRAWRAWSPSRETVSAQVSPRMLRNPSCSFGASRFAVSSGQELVYPSLPGAHPTEVLRSNPALVSRQRSSFSFL